MQRSVIPSKQTQEHSKQEEIHPDPESRQETEHFAVRPEEALQQQIANLPAQNPPPPTVEPAVSTDLISGTAYATQQAMSEASRIYNRDVSQSELWRLDKAPD